MKTKKEQKFYLKLLLAVQDVVLRIDFWRILFKLNFRD